MTPPVILAALGAYVLGSIPNAQWLVRWLAERDLSASGSANVGALNAMRVSKSKGLGLAVLGGDLLKGAAAVLLARALDVHPGIGVVGAVAGHNYNLWLSLTRKRVVGGKGFAAAAGGILCCMPWLVVVWLAVGLLAWFVFKLWRGIDDEAPASGVATLALVPGAHLLYDTGATIAMALVVVLVVPKLVTEVRTLFAGEPVEPDAA